MVESSRGPRGSVTRGSERTRCSVHVPAEDMGIVESIHQCLHHWVLDDVHARINRVGRYAPEASEQ